MALTIYLLQCIAFMDLFAVGLLMPLIGNHVKELGASHLVVGLMGSLYSGFQLGSGPLIGSLSDLKGRKTILVLTLLMCGAGYVSMGLTSSIACLLMLRVFLGTIKQTQMLVKALIPDYEKSEDRQSVIFGKMAAISGGGMTLGPIIGGHIVEDFPENGFTVNALIVGLLFVATAGLACCLPPVQSTPTTKKSENKALVPTRLLYTIFDSLEQSVVELLKIPWSIYWDIFLLKALVACSMGVYYSSYSLMLKTEFNLTPKYIGYTISFQGVVGTLCSYCIAFINSFYKTDHDYSKRNFHCFFLLTVSFIGLALAQNIYCFLACLVPLAMCNAVGRLVSLEMVLKKTSGKHRGTLIGASNSVRSVAGVVAPMVAGFVSHYYGLYYVLFISISAAFAGLLVSYRVRLKRHNVQNIKAD